MWRRVRKKERSWACLCMSSCGCLVFAEPFGSSVADGMLSEQSQCRMLRTPAVQLFLSRNNKFKLQLFCRVWKKHAYLDIDHAYRLYMLLPVPCSTIVFYQCRMWTLHGISRISHFLFSLAQKYEIKICAVYLHKSKKCHIYFNICRPITW